MKKMKKVMVFSLTLCLMLSVMSIAPAPAYGAADVTITGKSVAEIKTAIQNKMYDVPVSGGTVTVEGTKSNADTCLSLTIPNKVKVIWKATYAGSVSDKMIDVTGDGTFEVQAGSITAPTGVQAICVTSSNVTVSGGTVSSLFNGQAIYATDSNVKISGGTVSTEAAGKAISAINSNVTISGGKVMAEGMAYAINSNSTVTVTGGRVIAVDIDGFAIFLSGNGTAAYLKDTCTGDVTVSTATGTNGLIVEVDRLSIPATWSGNTGLAVKVGGGSAIWDMTGTKPMIELTLKNGSKKSLTWGTKYIALTGIKTVPTLYLVKGKSVTLPLALQPYNTTEKSVTWKSKSSNIAKVTAKGKVTGVKVGKTTITITGKGKTGKCTVYVVKSATALKKLTISPGKATSLTVGQTKQVKVTRSPAKATGIVPTFKSSVPGVAVIDKAGVITALKAGTTTITVKAGTKTKTFVLTVV